MLGTTYTFLHYKAPYQSICFSSSCANLENNAVGVMKAGNVFTIEPMISEGTWRDKQWPDNWTAVTADGLYSAQFEQTLLVTDTGCDILTKRQTNDGNPWFLDNF